MKKYIWFLVIIGIGIAAYFGYDYYKKQKAIADTKNRVLSTPQLRAEAERIAAQNKVSLDQAAGTLSRQIVAKV